MPDAPRPTEGVDHAQASRVAHTLNLGADGLPPRDLQTLARAYLDAIPRATVREAVARVRDWPREFSGSAFDSGFNAALDAVLAAMEGK